MRRAIQSTVSRRLQHPRALLRRQSTAITATTTTATTTTLTAEWRCYSSSSSSTTGGKGSGGGGKKPKKKQQQQRDTYRPPPRITWEGFKKQAPKRSAAPKSTAAPPPPNAPEHPQQQLADTELTFAHWQHINDRIALFSQLVDESTVATPASLEKDRLVDHGPYRANAKLWQILLKFRRRLYGDPGVREIFDGLRLRNLDLPTAGATADELWGVLLRSATRDDAFMAAVWEYVRELDTRTGHAWSGLYDAVLGHYFAAGDPVKARAWHYKLYPRHSSRDLSALFTDVLSRSPDAHTHLRIIHATTAKPAGVYSSMISALCGLGLHAEAVRWHQHCLSFDDLPADTGAADALVCWMARYGTVNELHQLVCSFVETGVRVVESTLVGVLVSRPDKMEALRLMLARSNGLHTGAMGDSFWAHVIAQRAIDREDVYRYLCTFAPGLGVGRLTVEAAAARFDIAEDKAVWLLSEIGILVRESELQPRADEEEPAAAARSPAAQQRSTPAKYRHPRTMADLSSQLQAHIKAKDWRSFDALLRHPLPGPPDAALSNVLLQSDLSRGRLQEALHRVEQMRRSSTMVSTPSLYLLVQTLLRPRRRGHAPETQPWYLADDVFLVIGLLFSLLRSEATRVEPQLWDEIFKRLGMMRRLADVETLALGLVDWYHPLLSARTRLRFSSTAPGAPMAPARPSTIAEVVTTEAVSSAATTTPTTPITTPATPSSRPPPIADRSRENPLRKIFHKGFFQAIVEWGFLTFRPFSPATHPHFRAPPAPTARGLPREYREYARCVPDFTWGVALAQRLRDRGVYVDPRVVERGVRVRLAPVFLPSGVVDTPLARNRMSACLMGYLGLEEVVEAVERAWGRELWERRGWRSGVWRRGWCECGKERMPAGREGEEAEGEKRERAMRDEVLGTGSIEGGMLSRRRRTMVKEAREKKVRGKAG